MKTNKPLTVGQLVNWFKDNNISDDTPIGIHIGNENASEISFGVIGDTECEVNDDGCVINMTETTGEHCVDYTWGNIFEETGCKQTIFMTDGVYEETI